MLPLSMKISEFLTCVGFVIWHLEDGHNFGVTRVHNQAPYMFNYEGKSKSTPQHAAHTLHNFPVKLERLTTAPQQSFNMA